ncbi:MAG TPA: Npt1/Npt2 family nucleotide transporter, partial [Bdellovibrionales bacterium]|nr:Npt1/Npt2 family nucleotide transporter [Bdellovibrionales bacterium]
FIAVGCNILIIASALWVGRLAHKKTAPDDAKQAEAKISTASIITEGARLVFRSNYLVSIMGIVAFYEIVSTIMDYQFTQGVLDYAAAQKWADGDRIAFFGKVFGVTNLTALFVQLFLTGLIMRKLGVGVALLVLPVIAFMGSVGFMVVPFLYTAAFLSVADNGFNYSINQSAKEALYVPTEQKIKYRAKGFIDIFVQRAAKTVGVAFNLIVPPLIGPGSSGLRYLSLASLSMLSVWIFLALRAGRGFNRLTEAPVSERKSSR